MDTEKALAAILQKLDSIDARLESLEAGQASLEAGQASLEAGQSSLEAGQQKLCADVLDIKERTRNIELKLENDIASRLDSLADGFKLNGEKLDDMRRVVDDIDSSVAALDVVTKFNTDQTITFKIVK